MAEKGGKGDALQVSGRQSAMLILIWGSQGGKPRQQFPLAGHNVAENGGTALVVLLLYVTKTVVGLSFLQMP